MDATAGHTVYSVAQQNPAKEAVAMKIRVGMDLASQGIRFHALDEMGQKRGSGPLSWSREMWVSLMDELGGAENVVVAFETGPDAYRAEAICLSLGAETYPFHAAHFAGVTRSKKKTDRIDARKIAQSLRGKSLPERVQLPCEEIAVLRNLVSERELHRKILRKMQNRARGMARQWDLSLPSYHRRRAHKRASVPAKAPWLKGYKPEAWRERRRNPARKQELLPA